MRNLYKPLGVHRSSTQHEIKAKWRQIASELHPDRHGGTPEANSRFGEVTAAYATLSDSKKRAEYHTEIDLLSEACTDCFGQGAKYKQKGFTNKVVTLCTACDGCGRIARAVLVSRRKKS